MASTRFVLVIVQDLFFRTSLVWLPRDRNLVVPVQDISDLDIQVNEMDERWEGGVVVGQGSGKDGRVGMLLPVVDNL